jgi:hypothetical protein
MPEKIIHVRSWVALLETASAAWAARSVSDVENDIKVTYLS